MPSPSAADTRPSPPAPLPAPIIDVTLLSNFTHQIINPLNAVVGTIDNLIDGTISDDRRPQRLKAVKAQVLETIELARNLAFLSELSTPEGRRSLEVKMVEHSFPTLAIDGAQFLQEAGERRHVQIEVLDPVTQYMVRCHKELLRQVLLNLIENAVKYCDSNTRIEIGTRIQRSTNNFIFEVCNVGPGFDDAERTKLFDLGFRGRSAKEATASGSGLGLFICKQILDLHGASIEAEYSHSNRTTIFRVRFPTARVDNTLTEKIRERRKYGQ